MYINHRLFELFVSILDLIVHNARIEGNLDSGIVDMRANSVELQGKPKVNYFLRFFSLSLVLRNKNLIKEKRKSLMRQVPTKSLRNTNKYRLGTDSPCHKNEKEKKGKTLKHLLYTQRISELNILKQSCTLFIYFGMFSLNNFLADCPY